MDKEMEELDRSFDDFVLESDEEEDFDDVIARDEYEDGEEDDDYAEQLTQNPYWSYNIMKPTRPAFTGQGHLNLDEVELCSKPVDYFNLFLTDEMVQLIVEQTNLYGRGKYADFEDISSKDIGTIIGIFIKMGYVSLPKFDDYWTTDPALTGHSIFGGIMSRKMFEQIMRSLRFEDNQNNSGSRLYKIERFFKNVCRPTSVAKDIRRGNVH